MPVNWTIKGEAGQGWNDTVTSLESKSISSAKVDFNSLSADELTFSILVEDISAPVYVATPQFTPDSSTRASTPVSVTISCATPGATIRYTTDGTDPTSLSPSIASGSSLSVAVPSTLKAVATKSGLLDSDIKVAEYVIQGPEATGGVEDDIDGYRIHTFLESGTLVVNHPGTIEYLVVAGGGAGGANTKTIGGGGGGAGGYKTGTISISAGTYAITVGAGGVSLLTQTSESDGGSSSIGSLVSCTGGGAGGSPSGKTAAAGRSGGSGGGSGGAASAGTGIVGEGKNGGGGTKTGTGGGANGAGAVVSAAIEDGGSGKSSSITGKSVTYAVGGGVRNSPDKSYIPNTGRGGAGRYKSTTKVDLGGNGSSGIVVIKYAITIPPNPSNIPSLSSLIPSLRQEVTLYRDGVSFFFGNVTNVRSIIESGSHEFQVTVSGPWWFLEKVTLTSIKQDASGKSDERVTYAFGSSTAGQDLKTSIEQVINRANQMGCPIASISGGSSVASMHTFPQITLNQSTCGQAISELVSFVPDAMAYFDYSSYPAKLKITRRPTTNAITLSQSTSPITSIDINPIIELEVEQVTLPYVTRDKTGRTVYNKQTSGTIPSGKNITKRQVITISGAELDTFLPNDLFDNETITKSVNFADLAHDSDSTCVSIAAKYGLSRLPVNIDDNTVNLVGQRRRNNQFNAGSNYKVSKSFRVGGYSMKDKNGNTLIGFSFLSSGKPSDWVKINAVEVTVTGSMYIRHTYDTGDGTSYYTLRPYIKEAGFKFVDSGFTSEETTGDFVSYWEKDFTLSGWATPGSAGTQTVYKESDYTFINPPKNLADFLVSTQNWVPYEGTITLEEEDVGATRYRGNKINLIDSMPAYSTMGALVSGESLEIETGITTITIGSPDRIDYRTLVDKIRKTSQDNIVYL